MSDQHGRPPAARARAGSGSLAVTWLGHATALLELDGVRLLTDPVLGPRVGPLLRIAEPVRDADLREIDAVLLSHMHGDHADGRSLRRLGPSTRVLAPAGSGRWLALRRVRGVEELRTGEWVRVGEVAVGLLPASHGDRMHRAARVEPGSFLVSGSHNCWFAGDTDLFAGMAQLAGTIDLALLPVAGWGPRVGPGHLDPERAAQAAAMIAPRVAVPIHWGTLVRALTPRLRADPGEPARRFAELVAERAPGVEVRVLAPGERLTLDGASTGRKEDALT